MCGIAGLVSRLDQAEACVTSMLAQMSHRGPDDTGIWVDPRDGVVLGHLRLAIIDTSPAGHQPMESASGRFHLTYNGEVYNYASLRADLESAGRAPAWRGHSDTEVLLAGFDAWGVAETLKRCNGMFALGVWDQERRELTLARDRMGEKPLYFGCIAGRFCFASELKAMTVLPGWQPHMAPDAIASYLGTGYIRGLQSAVEGFFRLPPGTLLTLRHDELAQVVESKFVESRVLRYWSLAEAATSGIRADLTPDVDTLHALLADAVRLRMVSDVPIGAFLSGGIDSSLVVALMQAASPRPVNTFSIGFDDPSYDEAPYARAMALQLGTHHEELYVGAHDALTLVPDLALCFDEPFADYSQIPTLLVSRLARRHVTVALSGDGGDELFAGYSRYFSVLPLWKSLSRIPPGVRRLVAPALSGVAAMTRSGVRAGMPMRGVSHRIARLAARVDTSDGIEGMRLAFIAGAGLERMQRGRRTRSMPHCLPPDGVGAPLRRLMYADQVDYLPDDILHKVDRAAMACSLETRVPLLDHRVVEASWRMGMDALATNSRGKLPLRSVLARYVPESMFDRPKQGFAPPMGAWLRGPLRDWAEDLLTTRALEPIGLLDPIRVRDVWRDHLQGSIDAGIAIWTVLMLSDWRRRFGAS